MFMCACEGVYAVCAFVCICECDYVCEHVRVLALLRVSVCM